LPAGKNLAGAFYFPDAVVVDPLVLETLAPEEVRAGLAEVVKYGLIEKTVAAETDYRVEQGELLDALAHVRWDSPNFQAGAVPEIIASCVRMKLAVVATDPREARLRRALNLGHTLGHALEKTTGFKLSHGQAVAVGLVFAVSVAVRAGRLPEQDLDRVTGLLQLLGLPTSIPEALDRDDIVEAISFDKKCLGEAVRFVLPVESLGCVDLDYKIDLGQLRELL
jgi:3-dehydroquinate synthetase